MKRKIFSSQKGYTLVEILAVIIVFSIIGGIIAAIFASSLRGSNKANTINEVRQNGNYALSQMSKMITYAERFDGISTNGETYDTNCYIDPTTSTTEAPEYHYLKISSFDGNQTIFSCEGGTNYEIASNGASLINKEAIVVKSCEFTCSQPSFAQSPTIGINFRLAQANEDALFESRADIPFEITVVMRNSAR